MNAVIRPVPCSECTVKDERIAQYEVAVECARECFNFYDIRISDLIKQVHEKDQVIRERDTKIKQLESLIAYGDARTNDLLSNGPRQKANYTGPERRHHLRAQRSVEKAAR